MIASAAGIARLRGRRVLVIDDPFAEGVNTQSDQRLVTDDAENMRPVGRQHHGDARFERDRSRFTVEPRFAPPGNDRQRLDIGMRMNPRRVAGRRGLDAGADRLSLAGVVSTTGRSSSRMTVIVAGPLSGMAHLCSANGC